MSRVLVAFAGILLMALGLVLTAVRLIAPDRGWIVLAAGGLVTMAAMAAAVTRRA